MNRKYYRFFGGFLHRQGKWLNAMAAKGYRLIRPGRLLYEFAPCAPGAVCYRVEFAAHQAADSARDYRRFLEEMGYRTWSKNINLNYSIGKVRWRPMRSRAGGWPQTPQPSTAS